MLTANRASAGPAGVSTPPVRASVGADHRADQQQLDPEPAERLGEPGPLVVDRLDQVERDVAVEDAEGHPEVAQDRDQGAGRERHQQVRPHLRPGEAVHRGLGENHVPHRQQRDQLDQDRADPSSRLNR